MTLLTDNDRQLLLAVQELLAEYNQQCSYNSCNDYDVPNTPFNWEIWKDTERQMIADNYTGEEYDERMAELEHRPDTKNLSCLDCSWLDAVINRVNELRTRGEPLPMGEVLSTVDAENGEG